MECGRRVSGAHDARATGFAHSQVRVSLTALGCVHMTLSIEPNRLFRQVLCHVLPALLSRKLAPLLTPAFNH
jgi:hypothetical protein